jgi:hypothetical protein
MSSQFAFCYAVLAFYFLAKKVTPPAAQLALSQKFIPQIR